MLEQNNITTIKNNLAENEEQGFDFVKLISVVLSNWYWVLLSVFICLGCAFLYLRYKTPIYSVQMKILVKDKENSYRRISSGVMDLSTLGMVSNSEGFENELEIITSKNIAKNTVRNLKLYVTYTAEGRIRHQDLYKTSPILVDLEESRLDDLDSLIHITLKPVGNEVQLDGYVGDDEDEPDYAFSQRIKKLPAAVPTRFGQILLTSNPGYKFDRDIEVTIHPLISMANAYRARMTAAQTSKVTTVASVQLTDPNKQRAIDYLNELVRSYNDNANNEKNEVALKTEEFINGRIEVIQGELDDTEINLQEYKQSNQLINLQTDATAALTSTANYQERQVAIQTQMTLLRSLIKYVNNPANAYEVVPANIGLESNDLNRLISQYNDLVLKRKRLLQASNESQPVVMDVTLQVDNMLSALKQMLHSQQDGMEIQKRSIDRQFDIFSGRVSNSPRQERAINNIMRQQELKAGLYLMLLQKREENSISLASTAAKARMVDSPEFIAQVSPKRSIIWLIALVLGFGLPIAFFYLREILRVRIEGQEDVQKLTSLPILANLPLSKTLAKSKSRMLAVNANTNNMMEEAFRGLRTNLKFVLKASLGQNVLLVTSTVPGEGKTFVSTNLAMSYALMGKKVLVVGLDIRKPRLAHLFGLPDKKRGITSFLTGDGSNLAELDALIYHGVASPNLDVLPAGTVPPNPGELIAQDSLRIAMEHLSKNYDIVILDTPPIGLVSDAIDAARLAHATLVITRADYSAKSSIRWVDQLAKEQKMPQVNIVLNGTDTEEYRYGYYGKHKYGYGYGYGRYGHYGYYGHYGSYGNYGDQADDTIENKDSKHHDKK